MAPTHLYIRPPLPLITTRMKFYPEPDPGLPVITPRMQFFPSQFFNASEVPPAPSVLTPLVEATHQQANQNSNTQQKRPSIPKPKGEPGRPNSSGFTLDVELLKNGWSDADVESFMGKVREAAHKYLDTKVSFRSQKPDLIQVICNEMSAPSNWPILDDYQNCWPVRSALKLVLKYKSEASRRNETKKATNRIRAALQPESEDEI